MKTKFLLSLLVFFSALAARAELPVEEFSNLPVSSCEMVKNFIAKVSVYYPQYELVNCEERVAPARLFKGERTEYFATIRTPNFTDCKTEAHTRISIPGKDGYMGLSGSIINVLIKQSVGLGSTYYFGGKTFYGDDQGTIWVPLNCK